jgi:diaphanous 1
MKPMKKPPTKAMKGMNWEKVEVFKLTNTVWDNKKFEEETVKVNLNNDELENLFSKKIVETKKLGGKEEKKNTKVAVSIVDGKKTTNLQIMLSKLKMSYTEIRDAILKMDISVITMEGVALFAQWCPSDQEATMIRDFIATQAALPEEERQPLGDVEQFASVLHEIPLVQERLESWLYKLRFIQKLHDTMNEINSMYYAAKEIRESREWLDVLRIVLELGNVLNYGTFRAGAWGFKIDALTKLNETKSDIKKDFSVLHVLCQILKRDFPQLAKFYTHLPHVEAASTCSLTQAQSVVSSLKQGLADAKRINRQVTPLNEIDNFKKLMSKFLSRASDEVEALEDLYEKTDKKYKELAQFYAEDPAKLAAEEFFKIINTFVTHVKEGYKVLSAAKKAEEAKARIEAKRQERMAEMGKEEEPEEVTPKNRSGKTSKSPRVGRGDAAAAVAGLDMDAIIGGDEKPKKKSSKKVVDDEEGGEEEEQPKPAKKAPSATSAAKRRVGKDEAQAALAGIDLDSMIGSGKKK